MSIIPVFSFLFLQLWACCSFCTSVRCAPALTLFHTNMIKVSEEQLKSLIASSSVFPSASSNRLVCHMTNWAQYRPGNGKFTADNIDPFLCTHVIYSLATINSFNQIHPIEWNDEQQYSRLNSFRNVWVNTVCLVGQYRPWYSADSIYTMFSASMEWLLEHYLNQSHP